MIKNQESRKRMGAQIAALRAELGMTQQELGDRAGIKQPHIARIEKGAYSVGLDTLDTIATAMNAEVRIVPKNDGKNPEKPKR